MNKNNNFWALLAMFALGSVVGFLFAPIRKGVNVRVFNNGNNYYADEECLDCYDEDWDYDDCDCDDCDCDELDDDIIEI